MGELLRRWTRLATLNLTLSLLGIGCAGYFPLRWPSRNLWSPSASARPLIELSNTDLAAAHDQLEKDHVAVVVKFIDREHTKELFHADLVRRGVQPLLILIHNGSDRSYLFSKAAVDAHYFPAANVARLAYVHPAITATRFVKWLAFLVPGVIMESVVEPTSTIDFPNFEDAAKRPPRSDPQGIRADFLKSEIADGEIGPDSSLAGVMFIHPLKLGSTFSVPLTDMHTRQPLVFDVPTPPPVYAQHREYPQPYDTVWDAAMKTAAHMKSWQVTSSDKNSGVILVRSRVPAMLRPPSPRINITVTKPKDNQTQVTIDSPLQQATSAGYGVHSPTIDRFFEDLDGLFPPPEVLPKRPPATAQPGAPNTSTGEPTSGETSQAPPAETTKAPAAAQ